MRFQTASATPRPVRLAPATRQWAWNSLHGLYGDDAARTPCVSLDEIDGFSSMPPLAQYDAAIRQIARQAPIRICPEERISGAATLGAAIDYAVPAAYRGACLFPGVNHLTIRYDRVLKEGLEAYKRDITARLALAADGQETAFLRSLDNVVEALRVWHARYLDAVREEKPAVYRALQRVPFAPARNFLEAVQALWFIFAFVRLCGNWPGIGRIDWLLGDYLQKDLAAGVLTKPEAREILASFFIKGCEWIQSQPRPGSGDAQHYQNIVLAGIDAAGREVTNDVTYLGDHRSIVVLGSGAYRIGSSVEFDWCGVQALNTIRKEGWRSVMINYNPETVSTDYDMCDRLYFDELTFERVMDVLELENPHGVIVSTGGQIPNNLALRLDAQNIHILGTSAQSIDNAEDRDKFSAMLDRIGVDQPEWRALTSLEDINSFVDKVGFPVLVRPSYVLSGAAMNVCSNQEELERFLQLAANVSKKHPVVVSQFIEHAKEVEMDAVAQNGEIIAYAISEHIEFAGVHSGDATIQFPPQKLYVETVRRIKRISREIAKALNISGPFNIQYLAKDNDIKVIECNLRASRSFPFVSKVLKINCIELATKVMLGMPVEKPEKNLFELDYVGIKASQFSFNRLQKADPVLGVDMASTGEVGCIGSDTSCAVLKAMLSVGYRIPKKNILLSTGTMKQKADMMDAARMLVNKGYKLFATGGTHKTFAENGIESTLVYWPSEEGHPQALEMLHNKEIDMVVNIPKNLTAGELDNGYKIRRAAIDLNVPLITNARLASAFINAFYTMSVDDIAIKSWAEYK